MTTAQWTPIGYCAECPTTHKRFITLRFARDGNRVFLTCRCCDSLGHKFGEDGFDITKEQRHEYELDQITYDTQGVTT